MNNAKRVLTFALAVCSLSAFASCGSSSDSSSKVVDKKLKEDQQQIVQRLADDMKDVRDLKSNEIKWFSHWDINPTEAEDKEIGADLALFKTKYNGKINWVQTTWETKFDDLAALVMSNDSPDFIGADDMDVFPKGAIKSMIAPIDDYIDLSKPLWTDIKGATDQFMLGDKHYVSVIRTDPAYVLYTTSKQWKITDMTILLSFSKKASGTGIHSQKCVLILLTLKAINTLSTAGIMKRLCSSLQVCRSSVSQTASL